MNIQTKTLIETTIKNFTETAKPVTHTLPRIKVEELGERAKDAGVYIIPNEFCEKLVALVVLECIDVFTTDLPDPGESRLTDVINRACRVAEHFGVKE